MELFTPKTPRDAVRLTAIKQQIAESLRLSEDAMVMVTELSCKDDDCPDIETVIAVLRRGEPKLHAKLTSAIADLSDEDVQVLCNQLVRSAE